MLCAAGCCHCVPLILHAEFAPLSFRSSDPNIFHQQLLSTSVSCTHTREQMTRDHSLKKRRIRARPCLGTRRRWGGERHILDVANRWIIGVWIESGQEEEDEERLLNILRPKANGSAQTPPQQVLIFILIDQYYYIERLDCGCWRR